MKKQIVILLSLIICMGVILCCCGSPKQQEEAAYTGMDSPDILLAVDADSGYKKPDLDIENLVALEPLTDPNAKRFVYIPASYFGVAELYGQEAIWGYMDGDEPALAIIHVEDGDITYKDGKPMGHVNYLDPGDIVESTSVTIKSSNPAEVYMDSGIYIEAGHDVGIYPFLDLIGMEPVELKWGYSGIHEAR